MKLSIDAWKKDWGASNPPRLDGNSDSVAAVRIEHLLRPLRLNAGQLFARVSGVNIARPRARSI